MHSHRLTQHCEGYPPDELFSIRKRKRYRLHQDRNLDQMATMLALTVSYTVSAAILMSKGDIGVLGGDTIHIGDCIAADPNKWS